MPQEGTQRLLDDTFDYGSGHLNPMATFNPGLAYDFNSHEIIDYLCSTGACPVQLKNLTRELVCCERTLPRLPTV